MYKRQALRHFDDTDGIAPGEWTAGRCSRDEKTGELAFASSSGFTLVRPEHLTLDEVGPPIAITRFRVFNDEVPLDAAAQALTRKDSVTIDFAVLSYTGRSSAWFMLEGLDHDWIRASSAFSATYSRLPPGHYKFKVRGANRHGVPSVGMSTLELFIPTPPWRTGWAYAGYLVAAGLMLTGGTVLHRRRLQRLRDRVRLTQVDNDLKLAAAAQSWFLPKVPAIQTPSVDVCGFYHHASRCGGDWWWYELIDDSTTLLLVGDVTGHGAGPAVLTASVATTLRASGRDSRAGDVEWRLRILHSEIRDVCQGSYQMTITAVTLHQGDGVARVLSAGGLPILRVPTEGAARAIVCPGSPLGGTDLHLGHHEFELERDDRLFLFTDGLTELRMKNGMMLGTRRLLTMIQRHGARPISEVVSAVEEEILRYAKESDEPDDITLVGAAWKGRGPAPIPGPRNVDTLKG